MSTEKSYYELLGVTRSATVAEIKEAYREIARVYHPDSNFYDEIVEDTLPPEALSTFKKITAAYTTLIHEEKRKIYNDTLPPELKDWDSNEDEVEHREWVHNKRRTTGTFAMGTFGRPAQNGPSVEEPEDSTYHRSVSDILYPKKKGVFGKLRSLLGL